MKLQEYVTTELEGMAQTDPNFRERYEDKAKSMASCLSYITQQARKRAVNNCAAISNDDVLQWAVHYYQEADIQPEASTPQANVLTSEKPKTAVLIPKPSPKKTKKETTEPQQLSLF